MELGRPGPRLFVLGGGSPPPREFRCPVCHDAAADITQPSFGGKSVRCARCGEYDISLGAWAAEKLERSSEARRGFALRKAKVRTAGSRPMILSLDC